MPTYVQGSIGFLSPITQVNRKFTLRKNTCSQKHLFRGGKQLGKLTNPWMGASTRTIGRAGYGAVSKNVFVVRENPRQSAPSANELLLRQLFGQVSRAVVSLMMDISQVDAIQAKFDAASKDFSKHINGVSAKGFTLRGWVYAVQFAGKWNDGTIDPNYNLLQFPANFDA